MSSFVLRLVATILVLLVAAIAGPVGAAEPLHRIGGTSVFGAPPPGFVDAKNYPGLKNRALHASIVAVETPKEVPLAALFSNKAALTARFEPLGVHIDALETLKTEEGLTVYLARGVQTTKADGTFDKWLGALVGVKAVMVTFQVDERSKLSPDVIRDFYRSLEFGAPLSAPEILDRLSFTIDFKPPFRFGASMDGMGVLLSGGPDVLDLKNEQAFIMVLRDLQIKAQADLAKYAETALRSTTTFRKAEINTVRKVEFAGREGLEFEGITVVKGKTLLFRQRFVAIPGGPSMRMVVCGPEDVIERFAGDIERVFASISLKPE